MEVVKEGVGDGGEFMAGTGYGGIPCISVLQAQFSSFNCFVVFRVGSGGRYEPGPDCLRFNAQFESGNLRKAIWVNIMLFSKLVNPVVLKTAKTP